jgi:hypothetical protein
MASLAVLLGSAISGIPAAQAHPRFYEGPPLITIGMMATGITVITTVNWAGGG